MEYKKNVNSIILDVGNLKRIAIDKHRNISENSVVYFNKKDIRHLTKLTSVFYGFVLLSIMNFVITLSK